MTATLPDTAASAGALTEARRLFPVLLRLAWPTMVSRAGILTMAVVDVAMVGRYSTRELAYASLANGLFVALLVTGVGLMVGVVAVSSQRFGAGREAECGAVWRDALPFALLTGGLAMLICLAGAPLFRLVGQEEELAREAGRVAMFLAPGLVGYAFFVISTFFLESIRRPMPGMVAMLIANLLNAALNWVFIYGNLGAPEMGAAGSALTTALVRCFLGAALVFYILRMADRGRFGLAEPLTLAAFRGWWGRSARARRIGYAGGAAIGCETSAHAALMMIAGFLGAVPIAAYSISYNVEATLFMAALGIGAATGVLVGNAWGRRDAGGARLAAATGLATGLAAMVLVAVLVYAAREGIAAFYTIDPAVRAAAVPLLVIVCFAIMADAGQMILGQSVRALGDVWASTRRYAVAFWGVMVPLGYWLAVPQGWGAAGLAVAVGVGCSVSMLLQGQRLLWLLRQEPPMDGA